MRKITNIIWGIWCAFTTLLSPVWLTMTFLNITGTIYRYDYSMDEWTVGKSIARIMNKEKMEFIFGKIFTLGFLLFYIGFLIFAGYVSIRDKNHSLMIFSIPFWLIGIFLIRKRFLDKNGEKDGKSICLFAFIVSALLVAIALLAGINIVNKYKHLSAKIIAIP